MPTYTCLRCEEALETKTARLPRGWKDVGGPTCPVCLASAYCVRAVTLPVARIVGRVDSPRQLEDEGAEPVEGFLRHFHAAWRLSTDLANWAMRELARRDVRRAPGMETLPKYDPVAMFGVAARRLKRKGAGDTQVETLYSTWNALMPVEWRQQWDGCAASAGAILKKVEDDWKGHPRFGRFAVLWRGISRPMVFGYPTPFPVPRKCWRASWRQHDGGSLPYLSVVLPGGRFILELDRSPELRDQLRDFSRLIGGEVVGRDVKILPVSRGGRVVGVKVAIAGLFSRTGAKETSERVALCFTGTESLVTVEVPDRRDSFVISGDQVRGAVYAHGRWLARYRNDMKFEKRWPARKRRRMVEGGAKAKLDRQHGRLESELKQIAAAVVGYVKRQRCGSLVYRDSERAFVPSLPWAALRERLRCLCGEEGIAFQHVSDAEVDAA